MILKVLKYGEPMLRKKGARVDAVTPDIKRLIADLLETMYAYKGVGLAAQCAKVLLNRLNFRENLLN